MPRRPRALVLVPTRELASQVQGEIALLAGERGNRTIAVYGGTAYGASRRALDRGVDIVVACPGRLEDLMKQKALDLSDVRTVVLDEADRMADMGFLPAVRRLSTRPPRSVRCCCFRPPSVTKWKPSSTGTNTTQCVATWWPTSQVWARWPTSSGGPSAQS